MDGYQKGTRSLSVAFRSEWEQLLTAALQTELGSPPVFKVKHPALLKLRCLLQHTKIANDC